MRCARCQSENREGVRFCEECGSRLALTCANCGADIQPDKRFCGACGTPVTPQATERYASPQGYTPKHLAEKILTSRATLEGERKQVTVLFADVKGSMELLADRDPEEARKLLDPVLERMMEAVHRYEGTVNQVMGDGIMALFGAPLALEDHAVRACYAALRMQDAVRRYSDELRRAQGMEVQIRVGVNSGDVVVRAIGSDLRMDYSAVGQTTHLAARMEQLAAPGSIRLTAETLHLAEGFVEVTPLGPVPIKGLAEPVELFELVGARAARTRLEAAARRGLTRFVGRDAELEQLHDALDRASLGHGQVVAVVGEPGVGKSRLFWELTHSHRVHGWLVVQSASVSYGKATAYLPVIELLRGYFAIHSHDDPRKIREKVTGKVLTLAPALAPAVPALLALLDAPVDEAAWHALDPLQRRQQTLDAVKRLLLRESEVQPLVVVFEDLHWIDGETQTLLDSLVDSLPAARLLLLVNYRPEYRHAWGGKTYYRQLRVDPLPPDSAAELLDALLGTDTVLGPLKQLLVERTEANPLFLEESVRALVETEALIGERGAYRLTRPVEQLTIPATVQAILAARIDRLGPEAKRLLQAAAVIGKDVPMPLLLAIADAPEYEVRAQLIHLQAAEFLYETRLVPDLEYTFKHALTLDVAYGSLLRERRRDLHARIMRAMERLYPDQSTPQLERLVHHARRGEVWDKALTYARDASTRALDRSAVAQALTHAEHALEALTHVEVGPERKRLELALVTQRATALRALRGYAAPEVESVYREAHELCPEGVDLPEQFGLKWQEMQFFLVRADLETAQQLASSLLTDAEARQDRALLIDAHLAGGMAVFPLGAFVTARDHFQRSVALCGSQSDRPHLLTHGQCPRVFSLGYLAWTLWFLGYAERAQRCVERAVEFSRRQAHPFTHVSTLTFAARVYHGRREVERVRALAEEIVALARDQGFAYYEAQGLVHEGWARAMSKCEEVGYAQLQKGCAALEKTGTVLARRGALVQAVEVCQRLGRLDEASDILARMQVTTEESRVLCWDAEIARLNAEIAAAGPASVVARQWYRTALATARAQGARALELRAAVSYGRAQHGAEFDDEARTMLAEVVGRFGEPVESPELREARALLRA